MYEELLISMVIEIYGEKASFCKLVKCFNGGRGSKGGQGRAEEIKVLATLLKLTNDLCIC